MSGPACGHKVLLAGDGVNDALARVSWQTLRSGVKLAGCGRLG